MKWFDITFSCDQMRPRRLTIIHERIIKPLRVICRRSGRKRGVSLCGMSSLCHWKVGRAHDRLCDDVCLFASNDRHTSRWSMMLRSLPSSVDAPIFGRQSCGSSEKRKPRASGAEGDNYEEQIPWRGDTARLRRPCLLVSLTSKFVEVGFYAWSR